MELFRPLAIVLVAALSTSYAGKISEGLLSKLEGGESSDAILELPSVFGNVMFNPALNLLSGNARTDMMVNLMKQATSASQAPFMNAISGLGLAESATPFWISNDISLKGLDISAAKSLAALPGVFTLREPETVKTTPMEVLHDRRVRQSSAQWGVQKIQAPYVWDTKTRGTGVVVAGIDTGVYRDHESIKDNYGGKWYDPVYGYSQPTDSNGHGTHTISTIVGRSYGIGVAPDAKWIACRGLDNNGNGNESWLKSCGQWVLNQKPKIVSNSWGGSGGQTFYNDVIRAWRAAGIIPVFSIGNSGPNCRTAGSPGDQASVISVGSTKSDDTMSGFSSRGYASNGKLKPEVSAPGDEIPAAYVRSPSDYVYMSGTSMACPHVAGAIALMLSANPSMTFDQVLSALSKQADRPAVSSNDLSCGKNSTSNYPNNAYGFGRINVRRAMGL